MKKSIALSVALLCFGSPLLAQENAQTATLDNRVQRLERLLESDSLMDMLTRLDAQQRELQTLRGDLEEMRHQLETLRERQRDLYLDTDRRLSRMEREGAIAASDGSSKPSVVAPAPSGNTPSKPSLTKPMVEKPPVPVDPAAEREAYQKAFDVLRELRYEQAITAFQNFLKQYPNGRYAHIAQYWLGEANYARRDFKQAIEEYRRLTKDFPNSPKVAEAMLKIGYSYNEMNDPKSAADIFERLMERFPNTTEAGQAQNLLKEIQRNDSAAASQGG